MKKIVLLIVVLFSLFFGWMYINRNEGLPTEKALGEGNTKMDLENDTTAQTGCVTKDETDDALQDIASFIPEGWEVMKKKQW